MLRKLGFTLLIILLATVFTKAIFASENRKWSSIKLPEQSWALRMDLREFYITRRVEENERAFLNARSMSLSSDVFLELVVAKDTEYSLLDYAKERWERMRFEVTGYPENIRMESTDRTVTVTYSSLVTSDDSKTTKGFVIFEQFENVWICARVEKHNYRLMHQKSVEELINTVSIQKLYQGSDDSDEAHNLREALQYIALHDGDKARSTLQRVIEINPNNGYAWYLLGDHYVKIGQLKEASEAYQKALEQEIRKPLLTCEIQRELIRSSAWVEIELGRYKQAERIYQSGIELDPDVPGYYFEYAKILAKRGQNDKAINMLELACRKALFDSLEKLSNPNDEPEFERLKNNSKFQAITKKYSSLFL